MSANDIKTRYVGTCAVCQKRQKLHGGKMVHHGYQRPGHGSIVGDCFAVGYEPYEASVKGCEDFLAYAQRTEAALVETLKNLESGEIRALHVMRRKRVGFGRDEIETVTLSADSENAKERADFAREMGLRISQTKSDIGGWQSEQARMSRLIAGWALEPVITWQEHAEIVKREKFDAGAERRAMLAAKRAERQSRAETLRAKREGWEAEKQGIMSKYRALFEQLAKGVESLQDRQSCARSHWADMSKAKNRKGYLDFYERELGCDDALVALGLAKIDGGSGRPWTYYADSRGFLR